MLWLGASFMVGLSYQYKLPAGKWGAAEVARAAWGRQGPPGQRPCVRMLLAGVGCMSTALLLQWPAHTSGEAVCTLLSPPFSAPALPPPPPFPRNYPCKGKANPQGCPVALLTHPLTHTHTQHPHPHTTRPWRPRSHFHISCHPCATTEMSSLDPRLYIDRDRKTAVGPLIRDLAIKAVVGLLLMLLISVLLVRGPTWGGGVECRS